MSPAAAWLLEAALPPGEGWLTPAEREKAASFPARSRRADWLLGRAAAKRLVAAAESARTGVFLGPADVEVLQGTNGAPRVLLPWELTLSHSGGIAAAALLPSGAGVPGVDLEKVEPRAASFVETFFTEAEAERAWSAGPLRDLLVTATWSAKEAVLKALLVGLSVDTRSVETLPTPFPAAPGSPWRLVDVIPGPSTPFPPGERVDAFWRPLGPFVLALAVRRASSAPAAIPGPLPHPGSGLPLPLRGDHGHVHPPAA